LFWFYASSFIYAVHAKWFVGSAHGCVTVLVGVALDSSGADDVMGALLLLAVVVSDGALSGGWGRGLVVLYYGGGLCVCVPRGLSP